MIIDAAISSFLANAPNVIAIECDVTTAVHFQVNQLLENKRPVDAGNASVAIRGAIGDVTDFGKFDCVVIPAPVHINSRTGGASSHWVGWICMKMARGAPVVFFYDSRDGTYLLDPEPDRYPLYIRLLLEFINANGNPLGGVPTDAIRVHNNNPQDAKFDVGCGAYLIKWVNDFLEDPPGKAESYMAGVLYEQSDDASTRSWVIRNLMNWPMAYIPLVPVPPVTRPIPVPVPLVGRPMAAATEKITDPVVGKRMTKLYADQSAARHATLGSAYYGDHRDLLILQSMYGGVPTSVTTLLGMWTTGLIDANIDTDESSEDEPFVPIPWEPRSLFTIVSTASATASIIMSQHINLLNGKRYDGTEFTPIVAQYELLRSLVAIVQRNQADYATHDFVFYVESGITRYMKIPHGKCPPGEFLYQARLNTLVTATRELSRRSNISDTQAYATAIGLPVASATSSVVGTLRAGVKAVKDSIAALLKTVEAFPRPAYEAVAAPPTTFPEYAGRTDRVASVSNGFL